MVPPFFGHNIGDNPHPNCMKDLECKLKGVFIGFGDLIGVRQVRSAGMGTDTAHSQVDTHIDEIVLL